MKPSAWVLTSVLGLLCLAADGKGCGGSSTDDGVSSELAALAEDAGDSTGAGDTATSVASIPVLALAAPANVATATAAAAAAKAGAGGFFQPAGCLSATAAGAVVTYTFNGCTGPYGLVAVNGTLTATFSAAAGATGVTIVTQTQNFKVNNAKVEQSATVTVTFEGTTRKISWTGQYSGTTGRRNLPITHTATYATELNQTTGCVKWDGTGSTTIGARGLTVTVSGYERCGTIWKCPAKGTIAAVGKQNGLSLSLTYLGDGKARLTGPNGNSWDYKMLWCTP